MARPRPRFRPAVETLEGRDVPATFTVTTAAGAGTGSLRAAITAANAAPGLDTIGFNIPGTGVQTINLLSALPNVSGSAVIDGFTQPGSNPNTLALGSDAVVLVELNGAAAGQANGLVLTGPTTSAVRGLAINRFQGNGIYAPQGNGHVVAGNVIGLDPTGTVARPNASNGVAIQFGVSDVVVGGASPADRNVISGNSRVAVQTSLGGSQRTRVEGNYLGTDATGTLDRGNGWYGVEFQGGGSGTVVGNVISGNNLQGVVFGDGSNGHTLRDNIIGLSANGTADVGNSQSGVRIQSASNSVITGNVISGNDQSGIEIDGAAAVTFGNVIRGNTIGLDASGAIDLGNTLDGVYLVNASGNTIGGPAAADRNVISGNNGHGIFFNVQSTGQTATNAIEGNYVGTDKTGTLDRGNSQRGLSLASSLNSTIRGNLVSGNDADGIALGSTGGGGAGATGSVVTGNIVGLNATGTTALGNGGVGVFIVGGNRVGGPAAADRNVIAGNGSHGVHVATTGDVGGTLIQGNLIGTDGTADLGNVGHGVLIDRAVNNTVRDNLISGNNGDGVLLFNSTGAAGNNVVRGNRIGVDAAGTSKLGNTIYGVRNIGQSANTIGGAAAGDGNLIGGNGLGGVLVSATHFTTGVTVQGNTIGTDASGTRNLGNTGHGVWVYDANGNTIRENAIAFNTGSGVRVETTSTVVGQLSGVNNLITRNGIAANGGPGIDLVPTAGTTGNDAGDADTGANQRQNFPLLNPGVSDYVTTTITGTLNSKSNTTYTLEFFASAAADPSGFGEGGRFLGTATVTTNGSGNAVINLTLPAGVGAGEVVTATATDPLGNTSEFSAAVVVNHPPTASAGGPYTVPENGTVVLDASATFDPEQSAASLTYAWDLDGDGVFGETGETGVSPTFAAAGLDGNGAVPLTVSLRVTDAGGLVGTATAAVTVANVAPTTTAVTGTGPIEAGHTATVSVSASDPAGALDPLQYEFDFDGDGTFEVGPQAGASASHLFNAAGSYTVGVRVTDGDGGSATGSVVVTVTNAVPVAAGSSATLAEDTPTAITLTATDHENDALTFEIVSGPSHGNRSHPGE